MTLLAAAALVGLVWWLVRDAGGAGLARLLRGPWLRRVGEAALGLLALLMLLRGRPDMALLLGALAGALAYARGGNAGWAGALRALAGRRAAPIRRRSAGVEVEGEPGGITGGTVLAGPLAGRRLDALGPAELLALALGLGRADPAGLALLEPYLDRRLPGWREHAERDAHARARGAAEMSEEEAYQVLGLEPGAGPEAVRESHRRLIKRLHPDQGGSASLAARVNLAKDVLLGRHRG